MQSLDYKEKFKEWHEEKGANEFYISAVLDNKPRSGPELNVSVEVTVKGPSKKRLLIGSLFSKPDGTDFLTKRLSVLTNNNLKKSEKLIVRQVTYVLNAVSFYCYCGGLQDPVKVERNRTLKTSKNLSSEDMAEFVAHKWASSPVLHLQRVPFKRKSKATPPSLGWIQQLIRDGAHFYDLVFEHTAGTPNSVGALPSESTSRAKPASSFGATESDRPFVQKGEVLFRVDGKYIKGGNKLARMVSYLMGKKQYVGPGVTGSTLIEESGIKTNQSRIRDICKGEMKEFAGLFWRIFQTENRGRNLFLTENIEIIENKTNVSFP